MSDVSTPCNTYLASLPKWHLPVTLMGGTRAMQATGKKYLPPEPREKPEKYQIRLRRTVLFNAYKNTVVNIATTPFSVPVQLKADPPESLEALEDNADRRGTNLTQFARRCAEDGTVFGLAHVLVDMPRNQLGRRPTLAEQQQLDLRPYFIRISPMDLISWTVEIELVSGRTRLVEIRYKDSRSVRDGWGEKIEELIHVYTPTEIQTYVRVDDAWIPDGEPATNTLGEIPLVTAYFNWRGFMKADPPLEDLAYLNLEHWQVSSDKRNILRFASCGMISATGIEDPDKEFVIGPDQVLASANEGAKFTVVEHSGRAIKSLDDHISKIEARMEVEGLRPFIERTMNVKATTQLLNTRKIDSNIQAWVRALERALEQCYGFAAKWMNVELAEDFGIDIYNDFSTAFADAQELQFLLQTCLAGKLSHESFLQEVKRRGKVSENLDIEREVQLGSMPEETDVNPEDELGPEDE